jgi:hypothetical protein
VWCAAAHGDLVEEGIRYAIASPSVLKETATLVRETRTRLSFHFGAVDDSGLQVSVAPDDSTFRALVGPSFPDWGVGAADLEAMAIVLKSPGSDGWPHSFEQVAVHEYAHIFLHLRAGRSPQVPRWLDEGFAMHAAFEWGLESHLRLSRAAWAGQLLDLAALEDVNSFRGERAALGYTQAFAAYQFLEEQYGRDGVVELLNGLAEGLSFGQAFRRATGSAFPEFQAALKLHLKEQTNVVSLLADSALWWGLLALLIVAGWWFKRRRAREIQRRWQVEDRLHGEPDFNEYVDRDDDESWRTP